VREPVTKVDERFSEPNAVATTWVATQSALADAELFWVSTVRVDGRPHTTPLVAVWLEDALYFCSGAEEQKSVNLRENSQVVLMTGTNEWDRGLDVIVEGEAVRVTDAHELERAADAWTRKWDGSWQYAVGDQCFHHRGDDSDPPGEIFVYRVLPTKVLAFSKGTFSHTTHRF
jgi:general stress protein 26